MRPNSRCGCHRTSSATSGGSWRICSSGSGRKADAYVAVIVQAAGTAVEGWWMTCPGRCMSARSRGQPDLILDLAAEVGVMLVVSPTLTCWRCLPGAGHRSWRRLRSPARSVLWGATHGEGDAGAGSPDTTRNSMPHDRGGLTEGAAHEKPGQGSKTGSKRGAIQGDIQRHQAIETAGRATSSHIAIR
jgi:hypothetical protein